MNSEDRVALAHEIARRILRHGVGRDDLEDCVQTVMLQLVPKLPDASIVTWQGLAAMVALRVKAHWIRERVRRRRHELALSVDIGELPAPDREDTGGGPYEFEQLEDLALSDRCRQVIEMLVLRHQRIDEIRAELHLTSTQFERSARQIVRAMRRLRRRRKPGRPRP